MLFDEISLTLIIEQPDQPAPSHPKNTSTSLHKEQNTKKFSFDCLFILFTRWGLFRFISPTVFFHSFARASLPHSPLNNHALSRTVNKYILQPFFHPYHDGVSQIIN